MKVNDLNNNGGKGRAGVYPTATVVECGSERVGLARAHAAALVSGAGGGAIGSSDDGPRDAERGGAGRGHPASGVCVDGGLVVGIVMHAFYNVYFATGRPVGSCEMVASGGAAKQTDIGRTICPECTGRMERRRVRGFAMLKK